MGSNEQANTDPRVLREERELKERVLHSVRATEVRAGDLMRTAGGLMRVERVSKRSDDRIDGSARIDLFIQHTETGKSYQWPGFFPDVMFCVYRLAPPVDPIGDTEGWAGAPAEFVKPDQIVSWDKGDRVLQNFSWYTSLADISSYRTGPNGMWIKHASWPGRVAWLAERAKAEASKTAEKYTVCEQVKAGRLYAGDEIMWEGRRCIITQVVRWPNAKTFTCVCSDGFIVELMRGDSDLVTVPCSKAPAGTLACPEPSAQEWVDALPDGSNLRVGDRVQVRGMSSDGLPSESWNETGEVTGVGENEIRLYQAGENGYVTSHCVRLPFGRHYRYHAATRAKLLPLERPEAKAAPIGAATSSAKAGERAGIALGASSATSWSSVAATPKPADDFEALRVEAKRMLDAGHDPRDVLGALDDYAHTAKHSKRFPPVETFRSFVSSMKGIRDNANVRLAGEQAKTARCYHGNRAQACAWCALARQRSDASVCVSHGPAWEAPDCEGE